MIRRCSTLFFLLALSSSAFGQSEEDVRDLMDRYIGSSGRETYLIGQQLVRIGGPAIQPLLEVAENAESPRAFHAWGLLQQMGNQLEAHVPRIVASVDSDDQSVRSGALRTLASLGPLPPEAIPVLAARMSRLRDYMQKLAVAEVLGNAGESAVPALTDLLREGDPLTQKYATLALGWNGPAARAATSSLTDSLKIPGKDLDELSRSVDALRKIGSLSEALPVFLEMLSSGPVDSRITAATVLRQWDYSFVDRIVPALIEALAGDDPDLKTAIVHAHRSFSPHARIAVSRLTPLLSHPYTPLREATGQTIRDFGLYLDGVIPAAIAALGDESDVVRKSAADILANQKASPSVAGAALTRVALEDSWQIQQRAREALEAIDPTGEIVTPLFIDALSNDDATYRSTALQLLAELGRVDADVESAVLRALRDPSPDVRSNAARAMYVLEIRRPEAIPVLIDMLDDPSVAVRMSVVGALSLHGADAGASVPQLIGMLNTDDSALLDAVIGTLGAIGPPAAPSVEPLLGLLPTADYQVGNYLVARSTVNTLLSIGPEAFAAVRRLVDADLANWSDQTDPAAPVDLYHAELLLQSGFSAEQLVAMFERQLSHANDRVVARAVVALEMLTPQSAAAIPALSELSASNRATPRTRSEAADAVVIILGSEPRHPLSILKFFLDRRSSSAGSIELLDSPGEQDRAAAAQSLGMRGRAAESAVPDLIRALSDKSNIVRHYAALSLCVCMIGPRGQEAFEPLLAATQDSDIDVRNAARLSLSMSGMDPFGYAPQDIWFQRWHERVESFTLRDPFDEFTVAWMIGAAELLGPTSVELLLQDVRSGRGFFGTTAIRTLGRLDFEDPLIVETLIDVARNRTQSQQTESITALGLLGSDSAAALPMLDDFKYHHDREVRLAARTAAERIRLD